MRPRDAIAFVNECLDKAVGKVSITPKVVYAAEASYSPKRLVAVFSEWVAEHPLLPLYCDVRRKKTATFKLEDISTQDTESLIEKLLSNENCDKDPLGRSASAWFDSKLSTPDFVREWIAQLYKVGIIGVKAQSYLPTQWSFDGSATISVSEITEQAVFYVHPMVWRALGVIGVLEKDAA